MTDTIATRTVRRPATRRVKTVEADICVLGAGIAGVSAALEAARLGRRVVIVDAAPALGGQAIGSIIGTIIGLYTHGPQPYQITHGIADDLITDLTAEGSLNRRVSMTGTITFQYDEVRLGRWIERKVEEAGIQAVLGAVLTDVALENRRVRAHRARDAVRLRERRGQRLRRRVGRCEPELRGRSRRPRARRAGLRLAELPDRGLRYRRGQRRSSSRTCTTRLAARGGDYGLVRHDGFLMHFPGKDFMLANVTHLETALDPLAAASMVVEGRRQADNVIRFLKAEFPRIFAHARIRTYGNPGLRQTRWIVGRRQLTLDDIRSRERPADAVARCAWWVELHNARDLVHWERFDAGHVYYIPLSLHGAAETPTTSSRPAAAWTRTFRRCRPSASWDRASRWAPPPRTRSTWRDRDAVHAVDLAALQRRLTDNLDRTD